MTSVSFTERMHGYVSFGESDYVRGYTQGRELDTALMFHLTIELADARDLEADAVATGWVECHALGGQLTLERGVFNCFADAGGPAEKNMLYRLWFSDGVGRPLTLTGRKLISRGGVCDVWPDTSTLYTRILRGHSEPSDDASAELVASGILRIRRRSFARQLTTFRGHAPTPRERAARVAAFNAGFAKQLWQLYGGPGTLRRRHAVRSPLTPG